MRHRRSIPLLVTLVVSVSAALAGLLGPGRDGPPPPFEKDLIPPDLVLRNQVAAGITTEQILSIKKLLQETQSVIIDKQADLQRSAEILARTVQAHPVDEAAALAAAEQVMTLETAVKKAHLSLLIRVKNLLTDSQVEKLTELRKEDQEDGRQPRRFR